MKKSANGPLAWKLKTPREPLLRRPHGKAAALFYMMPNAPFVKNGQKLFFRQTERDRSIASRV